MCISDSMTKDFHLRLWCHGMATMVIITIIVITQLLTNLLIPLVSKVSPVRPLNLQ